MGFPGYDNITGEIMSSNNAIKPDGPTKLFPNMDAAVVSLDADVREKTVYMHDENSIHSLAYVTGYNGKLENITIEYADYGSSRATVQIAVDWLSHTVYWADNLYRRIVAIPGQPEKMKKKYQKIIVEKALGAPMGIAVDPFEGYFTFIFFKCSLVYKLIDLKWISKIVR